MFMVANAFYNDGQFKSCCDVLTRILKLNPNPANKVEIAKLFTNANTRKGRENANNISSEDISAKSGSLSVNQFSLPAFDRFTKQYKRGDVIISEFEPGETFYLIKYGEVQIEKCIKSQNKSLDILGSGAFLVKWRFLTIPREARLVLLELMLPVWNSTRKTLRLLCLEIRRL